MQNKKNKKQVIQQVRRAHERLGILVLLAATLASVASISQDSRRVLREIALRPAFAIVNNSGRENETARMPVSYEGVFRLQGNSGR